MNKCSHCNAEIELDDNFCWKCGRWTAKGYVFLKDEENLKKIINGDAIKQDNRFSYLISLVSIGIILFTIMMTLRGDDLFKPFIYLKKQLTNYIYGYNTSTIKTDNKYTSEYLFTYEDAIKLIKKDFDEQLWLCESDNKISIIEHKLQEEFLIPSITFCDISYEVTLKLKDVIIKMYELFPNIKGALTNITITNVTTSSKYIAYFQPLYQFVNINKDINSYNKVNKTQILLNSYYFLNTEMLDDKLENVVEKNWYVNDATWESVIAHEIGHYISFVTLLKENGLSNITFETRENKNQIQNIIKIFNDGTYSKQLVNEALLNFNLKYNMNYDIETFALTISNYAGAKDEKGNIIADEIIAEAIHDYYLHENSMKTTSAEIINIIKNRLQLGEI